MLIFVSLALAGFLMVAGSFLFGGHDHDHDVDHGFDHDHDHDHGGGEEGNEHSISIFSTKILFTFVMGFGAAGAIGMHFGLSTYWASLLGVGNGVGLAALMYLLMTFFVKQQATSVTTMASLEGLEGTVTSAIGAGETGEIGLHTVSGYQNFLARSSMAIGKGRHVKVVRAVTSVLTVEEVQ